MSGESGGFDAIAAAIGERQWARVVELAQPLLSVPSEFARAHHALGIAWSAQGDSAQAIAHLKSAVDRHPDAGWLQNLGALLLADGQLEPAAEALASSIALRPDHAGTVANYGRALCENRQFGEAMPVLRRALALNASDPSALSDLGWCLGHTSGWSAAIDFLRKSVEIEPRSSRLQYRLSHCWRELGEAASALPHAEEFANLNPTAFSFVHLALTRWDAGDLEGAAHAGDAAFLRGVIEPELHSGLLYLSLFDARRSALDLRRMHESWALTHAPGAAESPVFSNLPQPDRKLKIGFVAGLLMTNPGQYFRLPLLRHLDRTKFDVILYNAHPDREDGIEDIAVHDISGLNAQEFTELVRRHHIDVLVDGMGHQARNRLQSFAMRAAPVQAYYGSYPCTTGINEFDAFLSDAATSPPGTDREYSEPVIRMPAGSLMYQPPDCAPDVTDLPAAANGFVTFGIFQRAAKLTPEFLSAAARIAALTPDSRLLFHHADPGFDDTASACTERIRAAIHAAGVNPDRAKFVGPRNLRDHLSVIAGTDIALDTFRFSGQTTTCECLWMGVPVVTLSGLQHAARVSSAILSQAGMKEWIAHSTGEFIRIAAGATDDPARLRTIRRELRDRLANSPLTRTVERTREIEIVIRNLWRSWCDSAAVREIVSTPAGE